MKITKLQSYAFFQKLSSLPVIEKIILYGSRARGDNQERSDIDLAIDCPQATSKEWHHIMDIVEEADTLLGIDCVRLDTLSEKNPLRRSILKDGILLYQRDSHDR